jgi:hypothetical protein
MAIAPPIEIDFRSGITTNESLLAIGARLWQSQNSVWDFRYPRVIGTAQGPWMHRQPLAFPNRAATTFTAAKTFRDIGFTANGGVTTAGVMLIGANTSDQYTAWPDTGGAALAFAGGVTRFTISSASKLLGCSVKWENPGTDPNGGAPLSEGIAVFSHILGTHVYYLLDSASTIRSLTSDVTNCPAGAAALAIHLDRLWLLKNGFLYYTDPLNIDSIRTTNVIRTTGQGRCLVPGQYGAIDTSGVPHLIIASANSVQVLDGDPQLGGGLQADLRTLSDNVGFASAHAAALTPYGVFGLGTDGGLWLIPPGCQTMQDVGGPIRDRLGINNKTSTVDLDGTATGSLCWLDPYLYIFPGGETSHFYIAEPTPQGVKYWGPMIGAADYATAGREAVIRTPAYGFSTHAPSGAHVQSLHSVDLTCATATARYLAFDTRATPTGSYPNGTNLLRAPALQTGLINVPGHRVRPIRVILETLRRPLLSGGTPPAHTVGITNEYGVNASGVRQSPVAVTGTYLSTVVETAMYTFPDVGPTRAFSVVIVGTTESNLAIQRGTIEYEATKAVGQVTP